MPLDTLITGRIATLAGDPGFGWVEAIGIRDGRVAFAGSEVALETRADPFTERIALEPDEVAIPGLTDAHLHLAGAALSRRATWTCRTRRPSATGWRGSGPPTDGWTTPTRGCEGTAGTSTGGAAGRPPPTSRRSRRAAGARCGHTTTTRCW